MPVDLPDISTSEEFIAFVARVSNPANQGNTSTAPKLLKYLVQHKHWSPFEMVNVVMEVNTTRDISRQLLRHTFKAQEFSGRYAEVEQPLVFREARLQDTKNRQNSLETDDSSLSAWWHFAQDQIADLSSSMYKEALEKGIAKEQARIVLPEGMVPTTLYVNGYLRTWIHYCQVRTDPSTQKEHRLVAQGAWEALLEHYPVLEGIL